VVRPTPAEATTADRPRLDLGAFGSAPARTYNRELKSLMLDHALLLNPTAIARARGTGLHAKWKKGRKSEMRTTVAENGPGAVTAYISAAPPRARLMLKRIRSRGLDRAPGASQASAKRRGMTYTPPWERPCRNHSKI
jgi:hypothetical protein